MTAAKDLVAVVTGASTPKGIGNAIAQRLAKEGASVFLVAEGTLEQLETAQADCRKHPGAGHIEYGVFDLSQRDQPEAMIADAERRFGRIDVLVNNAGLRVTRPFGDFTRNDFEIMTGLNIAAPFFASQAVLPIMRRQGGGRIINIVSQLARAACETYALYGLTKAALGHLTKSMAYELGREGIIVNSISPGPVRTQYLLDRVTADPAAAERRLESYMPSGRFGEPWEIADLAFYLATTKATFLQGEDICIDGGYTIH
jgi:NAD(P)-dependent dehydrogenase (short-subunit alcohol dehydrogenase family)